MNPLDPSRIEQYRQELRDEETPEPEPLESQELHDVWKQGNQRRPVPPRLSDSHKADLVNLKHRWITFAEKTGHQDWKGLIKTLNYENKGLGESFIRYLMRQAELRGKPIKSKSAIRVHMRRLGGLYRKYNACPPERSLMDYLRNIVRSKVTRMWALRRKPKIKPIMGPDFFIYHLYFLWVRDTSAFHIGLDQVDDACLRHMYMYTGCRKHKLITPPPLSIGGSTAIYCTGNCQTAFGTCDEDAIPVSQDGTCGADAALTCEGSTFGNCCSEYGYCGSTDAYCGSGCQAEYGTCTS